MYFVVTRRTSVPNFIFKMIRLKCQKNDKTAFYNLQNCIYYKRFLRSFSLNCLSGHNRHFPVNMLSTNSFSYDTTKRILLSVRSVIT